MLKILIVDTEKEVLASLKKALERAGFNEIMIFNNPKIALEIAKIEKFDVLITDIYIDMLGLSCISFIKMIIENDKNIKIILMTGLEDFKFKDPEIRRHVISCFDKPLNLFKLIDTLNSLVEQTTRLLN